MIEKDIKIDVCSHIAPALFKKIENFSSISHLSIKSKSKRTIKDWYGDTHDCLLAKHGSYLRIRTINDIKSITYHSGTRDPISFNISEITEGPEKLFNIIEAIHNDNPDVFNFIKQDLKKEIFQIIKDGKDVNLFGLLELYEIVNLTNERTILSLSRKDKERVNIKLDKFTYSDSKNTFFSD